MLKRIVLLAFLCAAFMLLLGLMVKPVSQQAPLPRAYPQRALLPQTPETQKAGQHQAETGCQLADSPAQPHLLQACTRQPVLLTAPYHRQFYAAFHYSDEAG